LVPGSKDGLFFANKLVLRDDVSYGGVGGQSVLVLDVFGDELAGLLDVERDTGPDAVNIEQLVPALDFAVGFGDSKVRF
jgi:hypothetical protein